ncbi:efflux RND transporter periplasmic adaptor subunit [Pelagibius sp.]|uniref:efflux RND transporter periplasmic adaptor subunit n=1 Tax=Pelagibius sp. TaxID=1931238 RepID=UPI0026164688|nr:HlyD family efflux transporter periplasmic adaptor subunit [Pelagibius sp.]
MTVQRRRAVLWGALVVLLGIGLAYAFWPRPVSVDFVLAGEGPLVVTVGEEGETRVRDVFVLSAPVTGYMRRIEHDVGDLLEARLTEVAQIEPIDPTFLDVRSATQAEAAVEAAQAARSLAVAEVEMAAAELDFAEAELERARRLIASATISERALDDAERVFRTKRAALSTAEAGLRMRDWELERARAELVSPATAQRSYDACDCVVMTSPVSGQILRIHQESEGVVTSGQALIDIGNPRDLEIVVDLLSEDAVKVEAGQRVIIEDWGGPEDLQGRVRRIEPTGFTKVSALGIEEQRVNVIIDITDPPEAWARLGHGYRVEVRIVLWESESVLKVPLTALFRNGGDWAVFVEDGGRARRQAVTVGRRTDLEAQVLDGLEDGVRVVLYPSDRVVEGVGLTARDDSD